MHACLLHLDRSLCHLCAISVRAVAPENAALIGQIGIPPLVALLANGSTNAQSHAAGALANCR